MKKLLSVLVLSMVCLLSACNFSMGYTLNNDQTSIIVDEVELLLESYTTQDVENDVLITVKVSLTNTLESTKNVDVSAVNFLFDEFYDAEVSFENEVLEAKETIDLYFYCTINKDINTENGQINFDLNNKLIVVKLDKIN